MFRPLLAYNKPVTTEQLKQLTYPRLVSPKLDGIRCIILNGKAVSRTLKPIPNRYIRYTLQEWAKQNPAYMYDGELIVGKNFQDTTSAVMSHGGKPVFAYWVFDGCSDKQPVDVGTFAYRFTWLENNIKSNPPIFVLDHITCQCAEDIIYWHEHYIANNYEGTMIRDPRAKYKFGRSTLNEAILLKLKNFEDAEGVIVGVEELMINGNESTVNTLGLTERSSHIDSLIPADMLGAIVVESPELFPYVSFRIGSGFTEQQRKQLWQQHIIGKTVKFKYQPYGIKDKPRSPIFLGFRED